MYGLRGQRVAVLVVVMACLTWSALFLAYDYRSPINQMIRGVGTVPLQGWAAHELDDACVRLEGPSQVPPTSADKAIETAVKPFPDAYVREAVLVSFRDTCTGTEPRLAWAVSLTWPLPNDAGFTTVASRPGPRAVVVIDAESGQLLTSHAEGSPAPAHATATTR